jgi:hypothetical protein
MGTRALRVWLVLSAFGALALGVMLFAPRIPQPQAYHQFADRRTMLALPNALNVLSNVPFAIAGALGLNALRRRPELGLNLEERRAYTVFFTGVLLTSGGSAFYHLAPDDSRLVWDRLPMTLAFMGLLAAVLAERVSPAAGRVSLVPLLCLGGASVVYWYFSETRGVGDLRPYLLVQFIPVVAIPVMVAWLPPKYSNGRAFFAVAGFYVLAKICEVYDQGILSAGTLVSGHTVKHLLSAAGIYILLVMLEQRHRLQQHAEWSVG